MLNFNWLAGIPIGVAKSIFLILFALIGVLVLFVPKDYMYEGLKEIKWYHNIKIWALGDLIFISLVYYIF
ncbi:MAG: hypothetical protein DWQ10_16910 [Calditrichaeota bacterium]|nr:MAG: hypothetical protein DWQ10_16910 [Calditrichota bacterium]